jgi:parallel beta-helix repeat protein
VLSGPVLGNQALADTAISSCTSITAPGTYRITSDIIEGPSSHCITILASDVVLDGQGHSVRESGSTIRNAGIRVGSEFTAFPVLSNVVVKNVRVGRWTHGIRFIRTTGGSIIGNTVSGNVDFGILLTKSDNNIVQNNHVVSNLDWDQFQAVPGIALGSSNNNIISGNTVTDNEKGILIQSSRDNTIYDNYFENTDNVGATSGSANSWNISKQAGTNIVNGPFVAGNYWATPGGDGFSETCNVDSDGDKICDNPYAISTDNTDELPLLLPDFIPDTDGDGVRDPDDNCPFVPNDQRDSDEDGFGDMCDVCPDDETNIDPDGDEVCGDDNCPGIPNPRGDWTNLNGSDEFDEQPDFDLDGVGDACDNCPYTANADQSDSDSDGQGDACGPNPCAQNTQQGGCTGPYYCDGITDPEECVVTGTGTINPRCQWQPVCGCVAGYTNSNDDWNDGCEDPDVDLDGYGETQDNCPNHHNPGQEDTTDQVWFDFAADGTMVASTVGSYAVSPGQNLENTFYLPEPDDSDFPYEVGNLIDGATSGYSYRWRDADSPATLVVKMPEARVVSKIALDFGSGADYIIEYSTDTTNGFNGGWAQVSEVWPGTPNPGSAGVGETIQIDLASPQTFQYFRVRLTRTGGNALEMNEISAFGIMRDGAGDPCDNCPEVPNPGQANSDSDPLGDACDNCPWITNPNQEDSDHEGIGDLCDPCPLDPRNDDDGDGLCAEVDNCPWWANANQEDLDRDGEGDACDTDDGYHGPNEDGPDCKLDCPGHGLPCLIAPYCHVVYPDFYDLKCIPLLDHGTPVGKIDIVFVRDLDYGGDTTRFLNDVRSLIRNGYFGATEFSDNICKFNFYYHTGAGNYTPICKEWTLPDDFDDDCSFSDSTAIIFTGSGVACAKGNGEVFGAWDWPTRSVVHETGHAIFDQADEYCCDGGYDPGDPPRNIFHSRAGCERNSSDPAGCTNFCPEPRQCNWRGEGWQDCCVDGGDGWWKSDADTCYMLNGSVFEPDSSRKVTKKLSEFPSCASSLAASTSAVTSLSSNQDTTKAVILKYNTHNGVLSLLNAHIVYNYPPDHFNEHGDFRVTAISSTGAELKQVLVDDPTAFRFVEHTNYEQGMMMGDDVDYKVILPFLDGMKEIITTDFDTDEVVHAADISEEILDFCEGVDYQDPQCEVSDLDNDGVPDYEDCDALDMSVYPGAPEICDGKDNNCEGLVDEGLTFDGDGDGYSTPDSCEGTKNDCDDTDADVNPAAHEVPGNEIDENCDEDLLCDPNADWRNHGKFAGCVAREVEALVEQGILTEEQGDELIRSAAWSWTLR